MDGWCADIKGLSFIMLSLREHPGLSILRSNASVVVAMDQACAEYCGRSRVTRERNKRKVGV